ncbi:MAG TPA: NAD(P)H-dependent oxidoreductase [Burkholderiales bacterium]|nr:NAD(P)H-dependent oxidoreductase [Burkholderiales bacterium]
MNTPFKVLGLCGSLRQKSYNLIALKTAGELMPAGMKLEITRFDDLPIYNFDVQEKGFPAAATRLRDEILAADALLFASPEYNWSVGAPLKNVIDWMSRFQPQPFLNKPAAVFSATTGPVGGSRGQYDLRRIMAGLGVHWLAKPEVFIGMAAGKFADGKLTDETTRKFLTDEMVAFEDWIKRIKRAFA